MLHLMIDQGSNYGDLVPFSRGTTDVAHKVVAVGSRTTESAQKFIDTHMNGDKTVKACGTYAEVYADKVGLCLRLHDNIVLLNLWDRMSMLYTSVQNSLY